MKAFALGYEAGSGKDTAAKWLVDHWRYELVRLAEPAKAACAAAFALSPEQIEGSLKEEIDPRWGCTPRSLMQWMCDQLRARFGQDGLARLGLARARAAGFERIVIPDVRCIAEAAYLYAEGVIMVHIDRPRACGNLQEDDAKHHTEHELGTWGGWQHQIINDNTLGMFSYSINQLVASYEKEIHYNG